MQTKLTLRLDDQLVKDAKQHARQTGKSLSQMVTEYFSAVTSPEAAPSELTPAHARRRALSRHLLGAYGALQDRLGPESASLLDAIEAVLHQRHRASSAIEGFNAALRPYLYVHKGATKRARAASGTQGFLDLFRAWFNLRTRRWGRHKGTSAHECLTRQRVHDWLTLLGYPPSPTLN